MKNQTRRRKLVDRVVASLVSLAGQVDYTGLKYFEQQLQPHLPRLREAGILINIQLRQPESHHEHRWNPINITEQRSSRAQSQPKRRQRVDINLSIPDLIEEADIHTVEGFGDETNPDVVPVIPVAPTLAVPASLPNQTQCAPIANTPQTYAEQPNFPNLAPRKTMRDMPLLARIIARILRYKDRAITPADCRSDSATTFQSEIEAELKIDMSLQGSSVQKLARLRRLRNSYFCEIKLMQDRCPGENERAVKKALTESLCRRLGGPVRLFQRLCKEIEIVDMISKTYSQQVNEIEDSVLLAISTECYAMSFKNAKECMEMVKWFTPWLTAIISPSQPVIAGFRIPEGLLTNPTMMLSRPPEALPLRLIPPPSALWDYIDERYLVISGEMIFCLCSLDVNTIIGEIRDDNKLGLILESPEGNCKRFSSEGVILLVTIVDIDEISELLIKPD
ncbi:hypothetical protein EYR41_006098 [Orbilia oligospora]|uniref:Uncharacterized protein n=1 Tax=Orbilia oligospora TaxID=2813651 RepID=A0A8H2HV65_ORBOL|nr:hypothetical protein EYR41_006098 [Orbilia oligospora]